MRQDVWWWVRFLPKFDNVSIMWMQQCLDNGKMLETDACLTRMGGFSEGWFTHAEFPDFVLQSDRFKIAHLEFLTIIVCLKLWKRKFTGKRFVIKCDN